MNSYILAIDQGTTGSTALVMSPEGRTLSRANHEFAQHFPEAGWVEHEPEEIWQSVVSAIGQAVRSAGIAATEIAAIGITNQRETTLLWDRASGQPVQRAIVWQDRRTADHCEALKRAGREKSVRDATGLVLDPYFSGTKVTWLLENIPGARQRAERGELAFGTVDTYLIYRLAGGGVSAPHVTDATNASRTLLLDLRTQRWSKRMCELLQVPQKILPRVCDSAAQFAVTCGVPGLPDGIPITGVAGDQHAALFGQGCHHAGDVKCTYGTGAFVLMNTGAEPCVSASGLLTTLAWRLNGQATYAIEGSSFVAGAAVQWLRDGLGIIQSAAEVSELAMTVESSEGVTFVPALTGLGAPHWKPDARGMLTGLTRGSTKAHIARATLEAIALQVSDLMDAMANDRGQPLSKLRVDGGAARNDLLMQLQADLSGLTVERPQDLEATARGAAMLAGLGAGIFASAQQATQMIQLDREFGVMVTSDWRALARERWRRAVARCVYET